jgi:rhodanese-related sulfurtransferase
MPTIQEVDVDALAAALDAGAGVVDVRRVDEYEAGHVPGAALITLQELPARLAELPDARPLYVVCRTGARSKVAAEFLAEQGIEAVNVAGGTVAWVESGRSIVTGSTPS